MKWICRVPWLHAVTKLYTGTSFTYNNAVEAWKVVHMCELIHVRNKSCVGVYGRTVRSENCI
jgi:hypothetical protein